MFLNPLTIHGVLAPPLPLLLSLLKRKSHEIPHVQLPIGTIR